MTTLMEHIFVTISRDGRVTVSETEYMDGSNMQYRTLDPDDELAVLELLSSEHQIVVEEGLTLRELLQALAPWKAILGRVGRIDIDEWLAFEELGRSDCDPPTRLVAFRALALPDTMEEGNLFFHGCINPLEANASPTYSRDLQANIADFLDVPIEIDQTLYDEHDRPTRITTLVSGMTFREFVADTLLRNMETTLALYGNRAATLTA